MNWTFPLEIALLAYIPGAILVRAPLLDRSLRAALPVEERVFWGVVLSWSFSCFAALALASVGLYTYGRVFALNLTVSAVALAAWRGQLLYHGTRRVDLGVLVPIALIGATLWLHGPPSEYVMGGKDPGTYMNEGIQIAQRGSLIVRDRVIATVPAQFRDLFFPPTHDPTYYGVRFMGFFIVDPAEGEVLGQFPHLLPASIALGYGAAGLTGARYVPLAWAIGGLIAVYLAGAHLLGRRPAAVGAALLAINVVHVWFARYPNAEVVAQAMLFAALLAYSRAQVDGNPFFGPVAASLLGLLLFVRVDMIIALGGFAGAAALARIGGARPAPGFFAILTLWLAIAALYLFGLMRPYMAFPIAFVSNLPWWQVTLLMLAPLMALTLVVAAARLPSIRKALTYVPYVFIVVVLALATYAYFFRQPGGRIAAYDAMAFRMFAWYVTPAGLALAVAGYVLAVRRFLLRDSVLLLTLTFYAVFFFYKIRIVPEHYWMARRFLPIILPAALLLVGFALVGRWSRRGQIVRLVAGSAVACVLAVAFWRQSAPLFAHVEYAGLIPRLEKLASRFGDRDLVIVESRNASDMHVLGVPLAYIYARNVLVMNTPRPDSLQFKAFLDWARKEYDNVYFVGGGGTDLVSRDVSTVPVHSDRFQIPEWESTRNALPAGLRHKEFDFSVYQFVDRAPAANALALDVGINDDLNVLRFHAKERDARGTTYRWTRDVSYVSLLGLDKDERAVVLVMNDGRRPGGVPPANVEVSLNDRVLGRLQVGSEFQAYTLPIPPEVAEQAANGEAAARLKLVTNTWRPRLALGTPDDRDLGVMVDRVEIR